MPLEFLSSRWPAYTLADKSRMPKVILSPNCCNSVGFFFVNDGSTPKRYKNKNNPDNGSVYGRHFASSLDDCIKLCQWSAGACRSVNFGTLAGQQVCEMLSVTVSKGSLTEPWLVDASGWQYVQVVNQ